MKLGFEQGDHPLKIRQSVLKCCREYMSTEYMSTDIDPLLTTLTLVIDLKLMRLTFNISDSTSFSCFYVK